ncbi:hypothetical protein PO909_018992 [Leuciscus waleckii]
MRTIWGHLKSKTCPSGPICHKSPFDSPLIPDTRSHSDELNNPALMRVSPRSHKMCMNYLEKEVQEVKATLQTMLSQLKEEEEEEEEEEDKFSDGEEEQVEDEALEEEHYFSDSWEI